MANWSHFYVIRIEFLGFRYHGWQKHPKLKSVQGMIDKTCEFILGHTNFKTLGSGRTDAKVSANDFALELFVLSKIETSSFLTDLNKNLPSDIRAKSVKEVNSEFNIIKQSKTKEYHYYFSFGDKSHPFNAPLIRDFGNELDILKMKEAAKEFEGFHNFRRYASKPSEKTIFERTILLAEIISNDQINGSFIPENSFVFKVRAKGFLTYQVRLMMGALVDVGLGKWTIKDIKASLLESDKPQIRHIAPSSGLVLHSVEFD